MYEKSNYLPAKDRSHQLLDFTFNRLVEIFSPACGNIAKLVVPIARNIPTLENIIRGCRS
jgi:hypothetical protein